MNSRKPTTSIESSKWSLFVKLMVLIFAINMVIDRGLQLVPIYTLGGNYNLQNTLMLSLKLPFFWTGLLVPITYLFALWETSSFLRRFEISPSFDPELLKHLQAIGADLMYAAMAAVLLVPTIEGWINQGSRGMKTEWDIQAVTIGMIGLVLKFVAQRACNMQAKVDDFV